MGWKVLFITSQEMAKHPRNLVFGRFVCARSGGEIWLFGQSSKTRCKRLKHFNCECCHLRSGIKLRPVEKIDSIVLLVFLSVLRVAQAGESTAHAPMGTH
jgi:hypothetical protein